MNKLGKLHQDILFISDAIHEFCVEHQIEYFLLGGTALGAARHKGFIPWDDDFDICMVYEQYEKFRRLWAIYGDKTTFYLQDEGTPEWPLYFSKLRLNDSLYLEKEDIGRDMHNGVYVDIMCLNALSNNIIMRFLQYFCAKVLMAEALPRRGYVARGLKKKLFIFLSHSIVSRISANFLLNFVRSYNGDYQVKMWGHFFGRAPYHKSLIKNFCVMNTKNISFEGRNYYSFCDIESYLKNRFGDNYMAMPSEETKSKYPSHCIKYVPRGELNGSNNEI